MVGDPLATIRVTLDRHRRLFDLERDNLGKDLCKAATDGVQKTIASESTPDGRPWAPLSQRYDERKRFDYPGNPMAVLHGTMANPREVAGEVEVTSNRAAVTYGVTEQARQEAEWFQEGSGRPGYGAPGRPFWGFTQESRAEVRRILEARLKSL